MNRGDPSIPKDTVDLTRAPSSTALTYDRRPITDRICDSAAPIFFADGSLSHLEGPSGLRGRQDVWHHVLPLHISGEEMTTGRLEAFSDGVIAIIITIMVLEMKVPHGDGLKELWPLLPVFLSYVLSFFYVGIYWNNHHHMLHACTVVTQCSGPTCISYSGSRYFRSPPDGWERTISPRYPPHSMEWCC